MPLTEGIKYCCAFCYFQEGCNRGACRYAHGSHNFTRHRDNGDCTIENQVCKSWDIRGDVYDSEYSHERCFVSRGEGIARKVAFDKAKETPCT